MSKPSFIITDSNITVNYDGETHIVKREDALADQLIAALKEGRPEEIPNLVSAAKRVSSFSNGAFTVVDGRVHVNGCVASDVLSNKIIKFSNDGLPFQPLLKFAENLGLNPSFRAVNELYGFLEKNDHPITQDGAFMAFKRVRSDFKDIHSGTFDNSPGEKPSVPRNTVDEDCNRTCSTGLHVANWEYAHTKFASENPATDIMLEVKVFPQNVVAVPRDYNNSKMRVCEYEVMGIVKTPFEPTEQLRKAPVPYAKAYSDNEPCSLCGNDEGEMCEFYGDCEGCCDCVCCDDCGYVVCECEDDILI